MKPRVELIQLSSKYLIIITVFGSVSLGNKVTISMSVEEKYQRMGTAEYPAQLSNFVEEEFYRLGTDQLVDFQVGARGLLFMIQSISIICCINRALQNAINRVVICERYIPKISSPNLQQLE